MTWRTARAPRPSGRSAPTTAWKSYTKADNPGDKLDDVSPRLSKMGAQGVTHKADRIVFKNLKLETMLSTQ